MRPLYERQFNNTMIRGTLYMLNDETRMIDREGALKFIYEKTGATSEDEIRSLMYHMSCDDAMEINVGMGRFLKPSFSYIR
jgi:hypothetical protein